MVLSTTATAMAMRRIKQNPAYSGSSFMGASGVGFVGRMLPSYDADDESDDADA